MLPLGFISVSSCFVRSCSLNDFIAYGVPAGFPSLNLAFDKNSGAIWMYSQLVIFRTCFISI